MLGQCESSCYLNVVCSSGTGFIVPRCDELVQTVGRFVLCSFEFGVFSLLVTVKVGELIVTNDLLTYCTDMVLNEGLIVVTGRDCATDGLRRDGSVADHCEKARPGWPETHCYQIVVPRECLNYSGWNYP